MFIKHQKILSSDKILLNSVLITLIVFVFDNVIIREHPGMFEDSNEKKQNLSISDEDDFENDLSDDEINEIIQSYDTDMDSRSSKEININIKRKPTQKEYYDSNMILY